MDAISMLKADHKRVEALFKRFEQAGKRAHAAKRATVDRIIEELSLHAAIEEQVFYPVARATVPKTESTVLESLEEHHVVKWLLSELETMSPEAERFDAKVSVLIENVRHHVKEEERSFFPVVRDALGRGALNELGAAMESAQKVAPTHPHPRSSDTPPGNIVIGAAAGITDRVGDTVSGLAQGGVSAIGDIIATVLGRQKPRVSPRGTRTARSTATRTRAGAADVTESAVETVREARRTGERTVRNARKTGSSARSRAKRTAAPAAKRANKTAKRATKTTKRATKTTKRATKTTKRATKTTAGGRTTRRAAARPARRAGSRASSTAKRARTAR
jgi:hemerythrin superfamily protein